MISQIEKAISIKRKYNIANFPFHRELRLEADAEEFYDILVILKGLLKLEK